MRMRILAQAGRRAAAPLDMNGRARKNAAARLGSESETAAFQTAAEEEAQWPLVRGAKVRDILSAVKTLQMS